MPFPAGQELQSVGHGFPPKRRASSFCSMLEALSPSGPPSLSTPALPASCAFSPSEDLHSGRVRYQEAQSSYCSPGMFNIFIQLCHLGPRAAESLVCMSLGRGCPYSLLMPTTHRSWQRPRKVQSHSLHIQEELTVEPGQNLQGTPKGQGGALHRRSEER